MNGRTGPSGGCSVAELWAELARQIVEEEPERAEEPRPDASGVQEGVRRPWLRSVLGG
jgi:hypothetical protein